MYIYIYSQNLQQTNPRHIPIAWLYYGLVGYSEFWVANIYAATMLAKMRIIHAKTNMYFFW